MTVALGLVCSDGVLVASDSMGTSDPVANVARKVRVFGRTPAVWTAAGSVFVIEEVEAELQRIDQSGTAEAPLKCFTEPDLTGIRGKLSPTMSKTMREAYGRALHVGPPEPGGMVRIPFASDFLMLGYANGTPWFLEFAQDGQVNWHTDHGFSAVGSGGHFATVARALMKHYTDQSLPLELGKLVAYRAIDTTIEVSSAWVGGPVQVAVCDKDGARILASDEIEALREQVDRWKQLEVDTLRMSPEDAQAQAAGDLPTMET